MISIKNLTIRNFMSVGNVTQAVNLHRDELTLILGENLDQGGDSTGQKNGVGKSAIMNALSYALFGQALTNIKKDNLVNKINNKHMLVTLTFEKDNTEYKIERGRKPAVMRFFINNKEKVATDDSSQGDMRETQKDIDTLLGMSHDMFKHIVALNTYTEPFLSMRAADQRAIIEQLLGVTVLSEKADSLKEQIKSTKDKILSETSNIEAITRSNEKIQASINTLASRQRAWSSQKADTIAKLTASICELASINIDEELSAHHKIVESKKISDKRAALVKEKATLETALIQSSRTVAKYEAEVTKLESKICPACSQSLLDHTHVSMTTTAVKDLADAVAYNDKISKLLQDCVSNIAALGDEVTLPVTFYDTYEQALAHQNNVAALEQAVISKQNEPDLYQEQIEELSNTALQDISWDEVNSLTRTKEHQEFLLKLLTSKDSFVRKKIIDQNLTYLNSRLTHYLDKIGLPHTVTFLNDLTVEITQLGQDLDFDNLSRGERTRLIVSMSLAFRDVWESLYEKINILAIDELLDNGLDPAGVDNAVSILKTKIRTSNTSIWLISHRDDLIARVSRIFKVIKENGFSRFESDDIQEIKP